MEKQRADELAGQLSESSDQIGQLRELAASSETTLESLQSQLKGASLEKEVRAWMPAPPSTNQLLTAVNCCFNPASLTFNLLYIQVATSGDVQLRLRCINTFVVRVSLYSLCVLTL